MCMYMYMYMYMSMSPAAFSPQDHNSPNQKAKQHIDASSSAQFIRGGPAHVLALRMPLAAGHGHKVMRLPALISLSRALRSSG